MKLDTYLNNIAKSIFEPIGVNTDNIQYDGIKGGSSAHWRERQDICKIDIPFNDNTKVMLKEHIPYFTITMVSFKLVYYVAGYCWEKQ